MVSQPAQKGFFAKNWIWLLGGVVVLFIIVAVVAVLVYLFVLRGNAKITDLKLSTENPVYGQSLKAKVTVTNSGMLQMDYHAELLADGTAIGAQDVVLEHNKPKTIEFDLSKMQAGDHKLSIEKTDLSFRLLKPAAFKVEAIAFNPDKFFVGDTVTANAKVTNTGEVKGTFKSAFTYDGTELDTKPLDLGPGENGTASAEFKVEAKGTHAVSIEDQKNTFTALNPAKIGIVDMKLSKSYAKAGEAVTVTVTLENTGDVAGNFDLNLTVNNDAEQAQSVTVDPSAKKTVNIKVTRSATGKYTVKAGSLSKVFSVVKITRPGNGTFLVSTARTKTGYVGYVAIFNLYSNQDAMFVLAPADNLHRTVLAVYVRAGQSVQKFFVKIGYYYGFYTSGGSFDSASRRFMTGAKYYKYKNEMDFYTYYYLLGMPNTYWSAVNEGDFPD